MNEDDMYDNDRDYDDEPDSSGDEYEPDSERALHDHEDGHLIDGVGFADPSGNSALRAATKSNPRNLPCPTCKKPNLLTAADKRAGYQCDSCADRDEGGSYGFGDY